MVAIEVFKPRFIWYSIARQTFISPKNKIISLRDTQSARNTAFIKERCTRAFMNTLPPTGAH